MSIPLPVQPSVALSWADYSIKNKINNLKIIIIIIKLINNKNKITINCVKISDLNIYIIKIKIIVNNNNNSFKISILRKIH